MVQDLPTVSPQSKTPIRKMKTAAQRVYCVAPAPGARKGRRNGAEGAGHDAERGQLPPAAADGDEN
eukprot:3041691-Prymnesium_polylepis.1